MIHLLGADNRRGTAAEQLTGNCTGGSGHLDDETSAPEVGISTQCSPTALTSCLLCRLITARGCGQFTTRVRHRQGTFGFRDGVALSRRGDAMRHRERNELATVLARHGTGKQQDRRRTNLRATVHQMLERDRPAEHSRRNNDARLIASALWC